MPFPDPAINATKAPGPPSSATEHPDHHNDLATAVNNITTELTSGTIGSHIAIPTGAHAASAVSVVDVDGNFIGDDMETVAQELANSIETLSNTPPTFDPQAQPGVITVVQYMTTAVSGVAVDGWYYPGDTTTVADLTSRVGPIEWHGTAAQKPADGSLATSFRIGDKFIKRPDVETL